MTADAARWDRRWADTQTPLGPPHPLVRRLADQLPKGARVLDVAAGRGRQSRALASAGHAVWAVDVSAVGLARITSAAPAVHTLVHDLTAGLPGSLPPTFDAVVCVDYRAPALWPLLHAVLAPGGHLLVSMATAVNLERHTKPSRRFLATPADIADALGPLQPVVVSQDWRASGRHELWVWARR